MTDLVTVELRRLPLKVHARASEHMAELQREFDHLRAHAEANHDAGVPARLLALIEELNARFAPFTAATSAELDAAIASDAETVDLTYRVPPEAAGGAATLGALLDEADDFCRSGEHLLTLATPDEAVRYRRWFLGEFVRQIGGEPPLAWDEYSE